MDKNKDNFEDLQKELKTRFTLLPEEIQKTITSSDYQMQLFEIAKKHKLTYEKLGTLELETTMVLLGMTPPSQYEKDIAHELGQKPEELTELIQEIKDKVFTPIRASLMNLYKPTDGSDDMSSETEKDLFAQSGVSIQPDAPTQTPSAGATENRADMIKSIENPAPSTPRVLNENFQKPASATIPVPRAPYAGGAPSVDAIKQPIPMTAKPADDILAGKLGGTFSMPAKETDRTIQNVGGSSVGAKTGDSYREPVE
jgi:hypothetical protein